jgi:large subunit ribosomal protein L9
MKVILLQDIPKIGRKYDVKDVADGYVRNFLLPRGMIRVSTANSETELARSRERQAGESKLNEELLKNEIAALKGQTVAMAAKASKKGSLFAGIGAERVAGAVKSALKIAIPANAIQLAEPIKSLGHHSITVTHGNTKADFVLNVINE